MEFLAMNAAPSASTILGKLGNAIAEKYTQLGGVGDEIQELKDELESMVACFGDVAKDDDENQKKQMRIWMKQVREVGYDAEDCIEIFGLHLSEPSSGGGSSTRLARWMHKAATLLRTLKIRNKLAAEIQTLKSRAQSVSDRRLRYKLDATEVKPLPPADEVKIVPTASKLYGMADYQQKVINFLNGSNQGQRQEQAHGPGCNTGSTGPGCATGSDEDLQVLSIVGSGGLGKTTLAMSVLNSPGVNGFERSAIVTVSRTYNKGALLKDIVRQLYRSPTGQEDPGFKEIEACTSKELIEKSKAHLESKRYLVILDDVWSSTAWQQLKEGFPHNGRKSRIIITTRSDEVATQCCSLPRDVLKMKPLRDDDSKKLLLKTVFGSEEVSSTYEEVCKEIVRKCGGLPLAIVSIGGMLAQRKNEPADKWKAFVDRLPSELEEGKHLDAMRRIISLSYSDMPYHLKTCFLYLSVFPEDYDIRRGPLIRRWEAEGFINEVHGLSMEENAKDYFDGFVSRSVVTREQLSSNGEVRSFRVHDIMLDIITIKSIQENFVSFLGNRKYNRGGHDKIRRLSIHPSSEDTYFPKGGSIRHVRSLTIMGSPQKTAKEIHFREMKLLRVLDLEGCPWSLGDKDWEEICKLSLLRYLGLRRTATEQLPSKIGKLKGLVTLDVRQTKVTQFPESFTQLQNLQHLLAGVYVHYTRTHSVKHFDYRNQKVVKIPLGLSKMKALKRISFVDVKEGLEALHEVAKLSQLTRLCVIQTDSTVTDWKNFGDSLSELSNSLRYLSVMQHEGGNELAGQQLNFLLDNNKLKSPPILLHSLHLLGRIGSLPWWVESLHSLASLSLRHTCIAELAVLERLPSLVSLKLYNEAFTGDSICIDEGMFPVLKQLVIDNLQNLTTLIFKDHGAKNLERLTMYFPEYVPVETVEGIDKLEMLQTVELFGRNHAKVVVEVTNQAECNPSKPIVTFTNKDLRPYSATN